MQRERTGRGLQDPASAHVCTSGAGLWALLALALTKTHSIHAEVEIKVSWAGGAPVLVFSLLIQSRLQAVGVRPLLSCSKELLPVRG